LQRVVSNFLEHYHQERNHQGRDNLLLFPIAVQEAGSRDAICCRARLGGLLKYFYEKVVKVKADVAAILKFFLPIPQI
jgi:hypothetical protein